MGGKVDSFEKRTSFEQKTFISQSSRQRKSPKAAEFLWFMDTVPVVETPDSFIKTIVILNTRNLI